VPEIIGQIAKAARASGRLSGASFTVNGAPMPPNSALTTAGSGILRYACIGAASVQGIFEIDYRASQHSATW
jgi:hypothetical protein